MLPTNASVVLVGVSQVGTEDGTPIYDEAARGPYRCWLRSMVPEELAEVGVVEGSATSPRSTSTIPARQSASRTT